VNEVVYITQSGGPRTEPWGTPQKRYAKNRNLYHIWHGKNGV